MSLFNDYIDGVPVKISERFKPPPKVELPYSVIECPSRAQYVVDNAQYFFKFEENVLSKINEVKRAKEKIRNERKHRIQLFGEAKQKRLDIIAAAEAEEKLKLLNVSEVSYPSTEEINDLPLDVKAEKQNFPSASVNSTLQRPTTSVDCEAPVFQTNGSNLNMETVLQPIQLLPNIYNTSLLDDPDPLQEFRITAIPGNQPYNQLYAKNYDQLTFQHFENDTSSPFDNAELKSLNDMEMLAQVLQREKSQNSDCLNNTYSDLPYQPISDCTNMPLSESYMQQPIFDQPIVSHTAYNSQHYPAANGYFMRNTTDNLPSNNMYLPNYFYTTDLYSQDQTYYNPSNIPVQNPEETSVLNNQHEHSSSINEQNIQVSAATAPSLGELPLVSHSEQYPIVNDVYTNYHSKQETYESYTPKSRCESVPPIPQNKMAYNSESMVSCKSDFSVVGHGLDSSHPKDSKPLNLKSSSVNDKIKELYDEITNMKLHTREIYAKADRPYNAEKLRPRPSSNVDNKLAGPSFKPRHQSKKTEQDRLPDPYETLPLPIQDMCRNIHHMGFPLDRVARVYKIVGDDDKKIIDILIIIGQLMDLGFSETKVTSALSKHGYDRDKALDELLT